MANEGEFFGGLGYLGQKAFDGIVGSLEGIWDYTAGGIAEIFGAHKFAEEQLKNDWIDYNAADEWFKPSGGWKTAGDVLSGIGNSLPSLAASIAVAAATGGASVPVQLAAGAGTSFGISFLSAGGNATKEAYQESGKLSGEEWGYGSLSGLTEGAVESAGTVLGLGQGAVLKALGKSAAKSAARTGLGKVLVDGFAGEAAEEFVSTAISPYLKRATYDKNAQNATAEELAYSAVVGGLSGMLMGGGGYGVRTAMDYISGGANVKSEEKREQIIKAATAIKNFESTAKTGNEVFEEISNAVDKLQAGLAKNGRYTVSEVKQLGYLNERIGTALLQPQFMQAAYTVLEDPEATVESINRFYNSDKLTVDELTKGVDQSKIGSKAWQKSVAKALKSNTTLRELVAIQTLGAIEFDARQYADAIFDGTPISTVATQDNLNRFVSSKDDATVSAVSSTLGIDLRTATADELAAAIKTARDNGSIDQYREAVESVEDAKAADKAEAKSLPTTVYARNDGARVYAVGDNRYAIIKKGNNYRLYDYSSGNISIPMSLAEMNSVVRAVKNQLESLKSDNRSDIINKTETENRSNESERVRIRDGGERSGGQNTEGQVSRMEGGAGQAESRGEASRNRNVEAARQADEGRGVKYVAVEDETASMKKARKLAEERGLKVRFFTGENLTVKDENGKTISARAYIKGNRVLVRADHQVYTEEQLMRHELGHDKIAKGEVDINKVRRRLEKAVGKENIDKVAKLYAEAYAGTGMTAKEIWEECICDSLGDMNVFAGEDARALLDKIIPEVKKAASESKEPSKMRGPPDGKAKTIEYQSPEKAKMSGEISDARFSIEFADDIARNQRKFVADGLSRISSEELEQAIVDTAHMVDEMKEYANILPQDKVGKTLVKNGSYDVSVENTTVCIRTLAYNSFVDMVSEKVGRPLTQMESFLVSQKLYEIAKEPQCLYCYVSLDRKAFNEMVIRYTEQRDAAIKAYEAADKPNIPSKFDAEWPLFKSFLEGRKPTTNMWDRYVGWLNAYSKGEKLVSLSDISTEAKRLKLVENGGESASQVKDILKYAQSASWAKKQMQYVAYYDEILKLKPQVIRNLNSHYGMRWYSFSDYSGAFIVENMQQITDAAIRGLKGLSYTKDTDFAEIFAPTGMNINISVYAKKTENGYEIDAKQSANIDEAIKLRKQYPNVGIVVVATDKAGVEWALAQEWSDVVIPFHTVRTGADVAEFYNWEIFNSEQSDTVSDQNLWDAYVNDVGKKKASKMVYPSEHQNNKETYLSICEKRGLTPRFKSFLDNPNYMKLVNETRQSEGETQPLKPNFKLDAAERSFDKFVEKGGYYEGWYNDGIDVDGEAEIVAEDVKAGKKANEVSYGRQDVDFDALRKGRKENRVHGKASRELDTEVKAPVDGMAAKAKAEKQNYKVYNKSEVLKAIRSIKLAADLTSKQRDDIATKLWVELNAPDKIKAKEEYLQGCLNRVKDGILNAYDKAASDANGKAISDPDTIKSLEGDIFDAVITLVELGGHESEKTKFNSKNKSQNKAEPKKLNELKPVYHVSDVVKALKNIPGNEIISPEVHNRLEIEMVAELNKLDSRIDEIEFVREYSEKILNMVKTEKDLENLTKESRAKAKGHIVDVLDKMLLDVKSRGPENIYDEKSWYQRTLENVRAQNEEAFAREKSRHLAEEAKHREKSKSALQKEKEYNRSVLENTRAQNDDRFERMKARHREKIAEQNKYYKAKDTLDRTVRSIRNKLKGSTFDNATVYQGESIKGLLTEVSAFEYRQTFSENEVREKVGKLLTWYNKDNPMLCYEDEQNRGVYVESIHETLEALATGKKKLTAEELTALDGVLRHFVHLAENYRKAWMDGKWVEAAPLAKKYAENVTRSAADVTNVLKIYRNGYVAAAGTPETVMLAADGYVDGFFSKMHEELNNAEVEADIQIMEIEREVDNFLDANKKYSKKLSNKTVKIFGEKFSKLELMEYYMTLKRKQAHEALAYNGIILKSKEDGKGEDLVIGGFAQGQKDLTEEQLDTLAAARRAEIEKEFGEKDKEFVKLLEKGYEATRDIKREADLKRLGISNVIEGYYYPIKRSYAKTKTVDVGAEAGFVDRFAYASFNKHAKEGAQQPIAIGSAYDTFTRHVKGIVYYSKVSPVVDTYNKMWKLNLSKNNNTPRSLETLNSQSKATWRDKNNNIVGNKYFRDEVYNIMNGSYARNALGSETIGGIRGKGAVAALAANLKVMITQISSWFAASSKLSYGSLVKGLGVSARDVDKYCKLAELRNRDKTAVKASGVIDTIGGVGEFLTKHISFMDRRVVCRLFGACQVEVAKNSGAKIGTEENKTAAGKLLRSVILETQQNSFVTSKNNMARNGGELLKSLMMFRSDAVQTQGKVLSEVGRAWAIRKRLKNGNLSDAERSTLKAELKKCNRNAGKAVFALALSSVWVVGASHIMNALFNKEKDKDEALWLSALLDLGGNMLGGLPGFADVYEYMVDGFDIESMEMGIINDMLHAVKAAFDYTGKVTSGTAEQRDTNALIKNTLFTLGQASGVPARNLYNLLYGITRRFNESAAYRIDDIFKKQNYNADFKDAAEGGKNELAKDILEMSFESNVGEGISEEALEELTRLASLGLKVAPSAISKSITIDGKEYELTEEEKETVQDIYAEAIAELNKLVKSKSYARLEDAEKEKEIKNLFTRYRKMGYDEVKEKNYGVTKKSSSPYAGLFSSKTSSGTSSGSSSKSYSALFSKNKKTSGAKSDKKLSYGALLGVK